MDSMAYIYYTNYSFWSFNNVPCNVAAWTFQNTSSNGTYTAANAQTYISGYPNTIPYGAGTVNLYKSYAGGTFLYNETCPILQSVLVPTPLITTEFMVFGCYKDDKPNIRLGFLSGTSDLHVWDPTYLENAPPYSQAPFTKLQKIINNVRGFQTLAILGKESIHVGWPGNRASAVTDYELPLLNPGYLLDASVVPGAFCQSCMYLMSNFFNMPLSDLRTDVRANC